MSVLKGRNGIIEIKDDRGRRQRIVAGGMHSTGSGGFLLETDFAQKAGSALPAWLATQDTSAAGSPTLDYVTDEAGGIYRLKLATDNEAEAITLYGNDNKNLNISKGVFMELLVAFTPDVTGAGTTPAANDKLVMGLASNRNATLDNITTNAWFMFAGANKNILVETDDGTTDNDDKDTGLDWVAGTQLELRIEIDEDEYATFYVNGDRVAGYSMAGVAANTKVQPFIELTKAAAANKDHRLDIDRLVIGQLRR